MKVFYERAQHESTRYEIPDDEKGAHHREFGQVNSFMKRSWVEVPDKTSPSRFMKPQCTKSNVEQTIVLPNPVRPSAEPTTESNQTSGANISEDPNQKFKHVALYMPYLTFGIQKSKSDRKKIEGHDIIHHSRTLDEFYYQFIQSNNHSQEQVNKRNKDQVITKWLYGGKPQKLKNWIVLKVDQLWLWIITSDTIITSSTNREDGRDDVIYREVFDNLKSAAQQPGSTMALAELIVKTCIHTYDRVPLVKGENETVAAENRETYPLLAANHPSLTIHEIFSNAINDSVLVESKLFQSLIFNRENGLENKYDRSSKKTAELLYQDKDLRDELHILRAVVLHQKGVLEELCAGSSTMPKTAAQILFDIEEMEKHAEKLHDTAYSILTIQQSNIAIEDSKESLNQSRAMMVFTIATHNDQGELFYSPKWIFPMIFGISFIVAVPLIFYAFHHIIPEYWNISLPMSLNGKKGNCEGDDWKSDDDEESKFGKSPDDSKYSSGACQSFSKDTTMSAFRRSTHKKLQSTSPV
ncbi:hypothetical protein F4775DRAFT_578384 [Biscogniauxia sp. FL1348]|nr:hypothetical protein F4775DRAFT_578384 [Biscogniauxia sp. FL1348]